MTMDGYLDHDTHEHLMAVIEEATENLAHAWAAIHAGEPAEVVDLWVDRTYDTLRSRLSRQELMQALLTLVQPEALRRAEKIRDVRAACPLRDEDLAVAVTEWAKGER
jgi:hypothetical protein